MKLRKDQLAHIKNINTKRQFKKNKKTKKLSKQPQKLIQATNNNMLSFFGRNSESKQNKKIATKTKSFQDLEFSNSFQRFSMNRHSQQYSQLIDINLLYNYVKSPKSRKNSNGCFRKSELKNSKLKTDRTKLKFKVQNFSTESEFTEQTKKKEFNKVQQQKAIIQRTVQQKKQNQKQKESNKLSLLYFQYYERFNKDTEDLENIKQCFNEKQQSLQQQLINQQKSIKDLNKLYQQFQNWNTIQI